ncbi:cytochrome oxidase complex assembly protein 1-domain-containing protein [Podospora australis]|uniref:Cytochrome oxidase complex assembly protein 1-domain-containing protein n=1 Tax=Podospora australis TaxID=1536484 RepID=A0AAN7AJZ0_9PEZI|nr:cytochrome oxidase complex assembly protein 1-domain-containing protein [Podospora australis]
MLSTTLPRQRASALLPLLLRRSPPLLRRSPPLLRRSPPLLLRSSPIQQQQTRTLIAAPKPGDGPLMERRPDRELPNIEKSRWTKTLPAFFAILAIASVAIFNYQKLSSPVVGATLYALRTSEKGRELLGDEIYFAQQIPWISGEMNQLHGRINISFKVKGKKSHGVMHFASFRPSPRGVFETTEWSLELPDGRKVDLLEGGDPFRAMTGADQFDLPDLGDDEDEVVEVKRGFRK